MQLVRRTVSVLRELGNTGGMTMQELATRLDVPLPSMHRLLGVLAEEEFVLRTQDRRYVLGPAALFLARGTRAIEEVARPYMRALAGEVHETVFLTELVGRRAVCVAIVQGSRALRLFVAVGEPMPFHAAASLVYDSELRTISPFFANRLKWNWPVSPALTSTRAPVLFASTLSRYVVTARTHALIARVAFDFVEYVSVKPSTSLFPATRCSR